MTDHTFYQLLVNYLPNSQHASLRSLDSLSLAAAFLIQVVQVVLIDTEGATRKGWDISDVVARTVLGAEYTPEETVVGDKSGEFGGGEHEEPHGEYDGRVGDGIGGNRGGDTGVRL